MDYRTLITLGRKAGLQTSELYQALSARRPQVRDRNPGQADGNGFISIYGRNGQRVYLPYSDISSRSDSKARIVKEQ
jgi:hypothetical protein